MKKFIFAFAAAAMVLASCQKAEFSEPVSDDFQLNVTVADLGGGEADTKAMIKTCWAEGDQISIWYDDNTSTADLVIEYDGSKWNKYSGNAPSGGDGKYLKAMYNGDVIVVSKDSYIFTNNTLTFNIANWTFLTEIQVVVTGITGNASDYSLACDKFWPIDSYKVSADTITATTGTKGQPATGFESAANPGCATFVFATADYTTGDATDTYKFTLKKGGATKVYTPEERSFLKDPTGIKAIKMAESSFGAPDYFCFTAKADGLRITLNKCGSPATNDLEYSTDGSTWKGVTIGTAFPTESALNKDDKVYVRAKTVRSVAQTNDDYIYFNGSADYEVSGNIMYLVDPDGGDSYVMKEYEFDTLFQSDSHLLSAKNLILPATTLSKGCYEYMFYYCSSLTEAPELPATNLKEDCYYEMFYCCEALEAAPALPAEELADYCYAYMFYGCTALKTAPALPAKELEKKCYEFMFYGCTALEYAPALPATYFAEYCYSNMFNGCTALKTAPASLPATTLEKYCYERMFAGCSVLAQAPALPATNLAERCYQYMFYGCAALEAAPALSATNLAKYCYNNMFAGCSVLAQAPELKASTLLEGCYQYMFYECAALGAAPALSATNLAEYCYNSMFSGCTSLTQAPELKATTLVNYCYTEMFYGCTSLNAVTCLATGGFNADYCLYNWLNGTATDGILTIDAGASANWVNHYPAGWSLESLAGTADVTGTYAGRTSCGWVKLWAGGPKWAEFNVGSTITSYASASGCSTATVGGLYAWGTPGADGRTSTWGDSVSTGTDDIATSIWGSNWQMPTSSQLNALLSNCDWMWCDGSDAQYADGCTLAGWKVKGRGSYASNSIFLPVGGEFSSAGEEINDEDYGYYWSSNEADEGYASSLSFDESDKDTDYGNRTYGYSVRAVLK